MEKEKLVHLENEQIVVSSRQVADSFGKEHRNLIRDIHYEPRWVFSFGYGIHWRKGA